MFAGDNLILILFTTRSSLQPQFTFDA